MLLPPMTERGCRTDRGRCFSQLAWNPASESVVLWFTDGTTYEHKGPTLEQYLANWVNHLDPGCIANGAGIGLKSENTKKLQKIAPGLIHHAHANDYTPNP